VHNVIVKREDDDYTIGVLEVHERKRVRKNSVESVPVKRARNESVNTTTEDEQTSINELVCIFKGWRPLLLQIVQKLEIKCFPILRNKLSFSVSFSPLSQIVRTVTSECRLVLCILTPNHSKTGFICWFSNVSLA
jgi:hypothetical protein